MDKGNGLQYTRNRIIEEVTALPWYRRTDVALTKAVVRGLVGAISINHTASSPAETAPTWCPETRSFGPWIRAVPLKGSQRDPHQDAEFLSDRDIVPHREPQQLDTLVGIVIYSEVAGGRVGLRMGGSADLITPATVFGPGTTVITSLYDHPIVDRSGQVCVTLSDTKGGGGVAVHALLAAWVNASAVDLDILNLVAAARHAARQPSIDPGERALLVAATEPFQATIDALEARRKQEAARAAALKMMEDGEFE